MYYWRSSGVSKALSGVTQLKIGDICLLSSKRRERDTFRGGQLKIRYILYIMHGWYVYPLNARAGAVFFLS